MASRPLVRPWRVLKVARYLGELYIWIFVLQMMGMVSLVSGGGSKYSSLGPRAGAVSQEPDEEPHSHKCARMLTSVESTLGVGEKQATSFAHKNIGASTPFPRNQYPNNNCTVPLGIGWYRRKCDPLCMDTCSPNLPPITQCCLAMQ